MFHVEHMKKHCILLILCLIPIFLLQSCKKIDKTPESSDPVFSDLKTELEISTKQEIDAKAQLAKDIRAYKETLPQTGMYTLMRNKMSTSENLLNVVQQQKKFFEIKMEQRKLEVRARYQESLKKDGRPWPDPKEIADYKIRMKLQRDKFQWDTKNVPRGTENSNAKDPKDKAATKAGKAEKPASEEQKAAN
jgi:hypothetical protein